MANSLTPASRIKGRAATQPIRVFGLALYISVLMIELLFWRVGWCGEGGWQFSRVLMLGAVLGVFVLLEWLEQRYFEHKPTLWVAVGVLGFRIFLTFQSASVSCAGFHNFFALIPPILAYLYIGRNAAYITAAINIVIYTLWLFGTPSLSPEYIQEVQDENMIIEFFIFVVGILMMLVVGRVLYLEERNRQRAERLLVELKQSQQQVAELAKVSERNRIARDIHDSVGHHLTAVNIMLEKAIAFRPINATEADQAILDAKRSAKSALTDVRDSVSALRETEREFTLRTELQRLVDGYGDVTTTLQFEGDETPYVKSTLIALYRVAQEGLTNIEKHSGGDSAEIHVTLTPEQGTLVLTDNGEGIDLEQLKAKSAQGDAHFGLTGLRERLELLGGTLTITSQKHKGTTLSVTVPARGLT